MAGLEDKKSFVIEEGVPDINKALVEVSCGIRDLDEACEHFVRVIQGAPNIYVARDNVKALCETLRLYN